MSDDNKEGAGVPVAWQERQKLSTDRWSDWYESRSKCTLGKTAAFSLTSGGIPYEFRPLYTPPPAVMPAAPSDAVRPCEYCDDTGDVHGLDGEWRGVCICPAGAALAQPVQEVATTPAIPKGDLSKVWQAADDVCEWLNYEVSEKSPGLLKSIETLNEAMGRAEIRAGRAEPAAGEQGRPTKITPETPVECTTCGGMVVGVAGEQAGAVASESRCPNCDDTGDVNSITGEWRGVCHCPAGQAINARALAAPGAAIAAREQEVTEDFSRWARHWFGSEADPKSIAKAIASMPTPPNADHEHTK